VPDQPTDAPVALTRGELRAQRRGAAIGEPDRDDREHAVPADWRFSDRSAEGWNEWLLAGALISLGLAILGGAVITTFWQSPWAAASATLLLWVGMIVPIVVALVRSRPAGLLRFRALDALYGVVLGALLRITQGWLELAAGGSGALPSAPRVDGAIPTSWWVMDAAAAVTVAPVVEELFFRGVLLVGLFTVLRRPFGVAAAGIVALLVATGVFVIVHGLAVPLAIDHALSLTLLGLVCGLLVLLTGRIWGAVLVHAVFNGTYVVLALAGTVLS